MKTIIIIESVDELLKFSRDDIMQGDKSPLMPTDSTLVFENSYDIVRLESEGFELSDKITPASIIEALAKRAGLKTHIT